VRKQKDARKKIAILSAIKAEAQAGQIVALMGPSGNNTIFEARKLNSF
jgi:hypothetical protein